jgi:hypothetical protein
MRRPSYAEDTRRYADLGALIDQCQAKRTEAIASGRGQWGLLKIINEARTERLRIEQRVLKPRKLRRAA